MVRTWYCILLFPRPPSSCAASSSVTHLDETLHMLPILIVNLNSIADRNSHGSVGEGLACIPHGIDLCGSAINMERVKRANMMMTAAEECLKQRILPALPKPIGQATFEKTPDRRQVRGLGNTKEFSSSSSNNNKRPRVWSLSTVDSHQSEFPLRAKASQESRSAAEHSAPFPNEPLGGYATSDILSNAKPASLQWSLSNFNGSIQIEALFPSLAHLDLLRAGVIQDPAVRFNEGLYRWIIHEPSWTYTTNLEPILSQIRNGARNNRESHWLHFAGLDMLTQVYVADELIRTTHNAHMWHTIRIPSHLLDDPKQDRTNLTLVFRNTNVFAAEQARQHHPGYPNQVKSPNRSRMSDYEYPNRIFVRKQQSDFGWDWGPALAPVGPHKQAYFIALPAPAAVQTVKGDESLTLPGGQEQIKTLVISSRIDIHRKGQSNNLPPPDPNANWIVNVTLTLLSPAEVPYPSLRLSIPELGLYTFDTLLSVPLVTAGINEPTHVAFEVPSSGKYAPSLWWPRGHGEQKLYEVVLHSDELAIEVHKTVGFRTAVFDLSPVPPDLVSAGVQPGSHFRLLLNDVEIYVMGTNMIPLDTLSPRTSPAYLRWLLDSALHANINLIRIWGGGSYPSQEFLSLCDQLGIMVWMDAMFAASLYPFHVSFLDEVAKEVAQVMQDVVTHPSLVVVVGNNEGELYFLGGYGRREQDVEWKQGYEALFDRVVRDQVLETSRGLSYVPCSTTTGYLSLDPYRGRYDNYTKGELHGTGEHYGYDASKAFDIDTYPRSRFMVEFGMFSLPSIYTLDRILASSFPDYSINSSVLRAHLKHPPAGNLTYPFSADQGQNELVSAATYFFPSLSDLAPTTARPRQVLHRWSYSSQLFQALYIANQIAVYRLSGAQPARNRGLIVWQLNDVWEGTSWSSIEYGGRWKMLHYALAKVQQPIALTGVYNTTADKLEVAVVYSGATKKGGEMVAKIEWFDFLGNALGLTKDVKVKLPDEGIGAVAIETITGPTGTICKGEMGCYLQLTLSQSRHQIVTSTYWTPMTELGSTLAHLSTMHRRSKLVLIRLKLASTAADAKDESYARWTVQVTNTGDAVAPFVWVEHAADHVGFFATCPEITDEKNCHPENAFWLQPLSSINLTFIRPQQSSIQHQVGKQDKSQEEENWFKSLKASSLFDNLSS